VTAAIAAFCVLLVIIVASGTMSAIRKKQTPEDYLVASRGVPPWLSALSAVATNNSGFMFIGMIAYTYSFGVDAVWMMVGWIMGDLLAWILVHPRVRDRSEDAEANTLSQLLRGDDDSRAVVVAAGVVTFLFLGVYAAAQLKAGSTALHALFGWEMWVGVLIGTAIVILYSFAGGIRADIWTDAAQSVVMLVAMGMILWAGFERVGGPAGLFEALDAQDPALTDPFARDRRFGLVPFVLGFAFGGFTTTGQPHLMVRYMSIESKEAVRPAGFYYFLYYIPFFVLSVAVGLYTRAIIPELESLPIAQGLEEPAELALPLVTMRLLPDIFVGVALAGLFAATVSTADSQIIVCSGAITHDVRPKWKDSYLASKIGTLSITSIALVLALFAPEGVFDLVLIAWSALGAALAPVLLLRLLRRPLRAPTAIAMMAAGIVTVIAWHASGLDSDVFKVLPGVVAAFAVYGAARGVTALRARARS